MGSVHLFLRSSSLALIIHQVCRASGKCAVVGSVKGRRVLQWEPACRDTKGGWVASLQGGGEGLLGGG